MLGESGRDLLTGRFFGVYAGTVHGVRRDGHLEVVVPSIFDTTEPESYALARPCFPYAHFFVPDVGDQVWVAFEGGDPSAPVWIGAWYAQGTVPAEADTDPPLRRVIRTPSGHVVSFDDTPGAERLTFADKTGNRIELRTDGVLIKCLQKLTIDASGQEIDITASKVNVKEG